MDTSTFLKRAIEFQSSLKEGAFPNASTLADLSGCSRSQISTDRLESSRACSHNDGGFRRGLS
jgi:hypothetical protein